VYFGTPEEKYLTRIALEEAERYHAEGHFPPGSMGPKIEAAISFLRAGGKKAIITSAEKLDAALNGKGGTEITH
jgi:carbamate kinase